MGVHHQHGALEHWDHDQVVRLGRVLAAQAARAFGRAACCDGVLCAAG